MLVWTETHYFDFVKMLRNLNVIEMDMDHLRKVLIRSTPLADCEVTADRHRQLSFNEWLETLCRICHAHFRAHPPPEDPRGCMLTNKTLEQFLKAVVAHFIRH